VKARRLSGVSTSASVAPSRKPVTSSFTLNDGVPDVARRSAAVSAVMSKDPDLLPPQSLGVSGRPRSDNSDSDSVTQDREANVKPAPVSRATESSTLLSSMRSVLRQRQEKRERLNHAHASVDSLSHAASIGDSDLNASSGEETGSG
jgi:hypothetical protein